MQNNISVALATAKQALNSVNDAYWKSTNDTFRQDLSDLALNTNDLIAGLSQQDLASNTAAFNTVSQLVKSSIMPKIKKTQDQLNLIVSVDNDFKVVSSDLVKLASSLTFLQVDL
jgi:hypothetical protein